MKRRLISVREASRIYCVSKSALYSWALGGRIPSAKIGRLRRFWVDELDEFFRSWSAYLDEHHRMPKKRRSFIEGNQHMEKRNELTSRGRF
jgi:excisionase family DNA binding protein